MTCTAAHCPTFNVAASATVMAYCISQRITTYAPVMWGVYTAVPVDKPACGFRNENCPEVVQQSSKTVGLIPLYLAGHVTAIAWILAIPYNIYDDNNY